MFEIEKGISIPNRLPRRPYGEYSAAAAKMEPGDSIAFDDKKKAIFLYGALTRQRKKGALRKLPNGEYRVWRVQ